MEKETCKCGLCRKECTDEELSDSYEYAVCKRCAREINHYGSE